MFLFVDYQKVFDADHSSHVAREALMVSECLICKIHP